MPLARVVIRIDVASRHSLARAGTFIRSEGDWKKRVSLKSKDTSHVTLVPALVEQEKVAGCYNAQGGEIVQVVLIVVRRRRLPTSPEL
jgi:hypothetical protein